MSENGEEDAGWRKCVEAPTLEEVVSEAEKLVNNISPDDYWRQTYGEPEDRDSCVFCGSSKLDRYCDSSPDGEHHSESGG